MSVPQYVAAVDLGSNSFHLVVMKNENNRLVSVDCRREMVRLAAGVERGKINPQTKGRALRCLTHFHDYLRAFPSVTVSAVGTSAFRMLEKDSDFLKLAERALGQPIRVLTGDDEARYIYRGVTQGQPSSRYFVLDIGGGSTEIIVGADKDPVVVASLDLGCITLTADFLRYDNLSGEQLDACIEYIDGQLDKVSPLFSDVQWQDVMGASGTIKTVSWAMNNLGIAQEGVIERKQLDRLLPLLTQTESQQQLCHLLELNPRRIGVFAAGYLIMYRIFHRFNLQQMRISNKAIREGLLEELVTAPPVN